MTLALEIIGPQAQQLGAAARKEFTAAGGSIGRLPDNDWVIPDPFISGRHARIHYRDGHYLLEDTSTNGVFVNSRDARLGKGQTHVLRSGDHFFVDAYEVKATIHDSAPLTERMATRMDAAAEPQSDSFLTLPLREAADAFSQARTPEDEDVRDARTVAMPPGVSPEPPRNAAPNDKPPETSMPRHSGKGAKAAAKKSTAVEASADFAVLLKAAGMPTVQLTPELSENLGRVLQVVVAGLIETLRSREQIKDEFGMQATRFKPAENNPLKFSANVEDALHNLFIKHNAAYLGPVEAFEDALAEVRHHQLAMLAAVRTIFRAMLREFEPRRLEDECARQSKGGLLAAVPAKLRYWDFYRDKARRLADDPDGCFRELFGEQFAAAYAEQLEALKTASRSKPPRA